MLLAFYVANVQFLLLKCPLNDRRFAMAFMLGDFFFDLAAIFVIVAVLFVVDKREKTNGNFRQ